MFDSVLNSPWVGGAQFTVQNFEKRGGGGGQQKKNECLEGLKDVLPWIFTWGGYYVSCQKKNFRNKIWI